MNKTHGDTLIEGSMEKPRFPEPVKLVGADTGILGINANEEAHCLPSPPVGGFPPPANNLNNPVEALPPDKGRRY